MKTTSLPVNVFAFSTITVKLNYSVFVGWDDIKTSLKESLSILMFSSYCTKGDRPNDSGRDILFLDDYTHDRT